MNTPELPRDSEAHRVLLGAGDLAYALADDVADARHRLTAEYQGIAAETADRHLVQEVERMLEAEFGMPQAARRSLLDTLGSMGGTARREALLTLAATLLALLANDLTDLLP